MLRRGEVAGTFLCVMQETAKSCEKVLSFLQEIQNVPLGVLPSDHWALPITSFRYQLVQGIADRVQHSTHMCSLEGTCITATAHEQPHVHAATLCIPHICAYGKSHVREQTHSHICLHPP